MRRSSLSLGLLVALVIAVAAPALAQTDAPVETPGPLPTPVEEPKDEEPPRIHITTRRGRVVLGNVTRRAPIAARFDEPVRATLSVTTLKGRLVARIPTAPRLLSKSVGRWAGGDLRGRLVKPGLYVFVVRAEDAAGNVRVRRTRVSALARGYSASAPVDYTYVLEARDVPSSAMAEFARVAALTLSDMRGWSLRRNVSYRRVASGGDFRLILASPGSIAAASGACSSYWSCRVGTQVLVNVDRWRYATPTWTKTRPEYRSYVINHEVGHWLGLGHDYCGGAGRPAPVMMQQSKGTYGCRNNVWPLEYERARVASIRGAGGWPLPPLGSPCTIVGTGRADRLMGTSQPDVICGFGGDDQLHGLGGNDVLRGGVGTDALHGGAGADRRSGDRDRCRSCATFAPTSRVPHGEPMTPVTRRRVDVE